jgi:hypothetical protein
MVEALVTPNPSLNSDPQQGLPLRGDVAARLARRGGCRKSPQHAALVNFKPKESMTYGAQKSTKRLFLQPR